MIGLGNKMRILGVDPGTKILGYCVIDLNNEALQCLTWGVVKGGPSKEVANRLGILYSGLHDIIEEWKPDVLAIEEPFVAPTRGAIPLRSDKCKKYSRKLRRGVQAASTTFCTGFARARGRRNV